MLCRLVIHFESVSAGGAVYLSIVVYRVFQDPLFIYGMTRRQQHSVKNCRDSIKALKDTLYVISGKWRIFVIVALIEGPKRFNEIQRSVGGITPRALSRELHELELNMFVERAEDDRTPGKVIYKLTPYSNSFRKLLDALVAWGENHKKHVFGRIGDTQQKSKKGKGKTPEPDW
ncbi:helix-turn-helix domain-containing protein [Chryseolinea sp. T2]|uniref:winged helix-turn-helix transcriptional regulator n=1 Tax=Chryseolinea sp. T2 TaxID=3129255 RepID=UPI0030771E08